ncbi:MAG TPA: septum formation initiator family protein [Candidatus Dormibacteraeota bacterium]|nr:septum formation initiator family protein [Candidatus Dormibacteraeota bacterium]
MRQNKALSAAGTVRASSFGVRQLFVLVIAGIAVVWGGIAFAQEAYVSHKLGQQVADLRRQNAEIAAQNAGYKKDVQGLTNGTANEEEARLNGYARPNEKTYLVTTQPSPSPSPSASPSAKASPSASPKAH